LHLLISRKDAKSAEKSAERLFETLFGGGIEAVFLTASYFSLT